MCYDNEEWCKIWKGIDLSVQNWHEEYDECWPEHLKISQICTLIDCFWPKYIYIMFELNKVQRSYVWWHCVLMRKVVYIGADEIQFLPWPKLCITVIFEDMRKIWETEINIDHVVQSKHVITTWLLTLNMSKIVNSSFMTGSKKTHKNKFWILINN